MLTWKTKKIIYGILISFSVLICPKLVVENETFSYATSLQTEINQVVSLIEEEPSSTKMMDPWKLAQSVVSIGHYYHVDPLLILSIVKTESRFRPTVVSGAGAIGLMQVMPIVMREVGEEVYVSKTEHLYDPGKNLHIGTYYFTLLLEQYHNNLPKALTAYNMGPVALDHLIANKQQIPQSYSRKVLNTYLSYQDRL